MFKIKGYKYFRLDSSTNELHELFIYKDNTLSDTHDLLNCNCSKPLNKIPLHKRKAASVDELANWVHCYELSQLTQNPVLQRAAPKTVSFVFLKEEDPQKEYNKKTKQMTLKKEKLTFGPEGEQAEEDEADYSYAEEESDPITEKKSTEEQEDTTSEKNDMDVGQDDEQTEEKKSRTKQKDEEMDAEKEEEEESEKEEVNENEQKGNSRKRARTEEEEKPSKRARSKKAQPKEEETEPVKKSARVQTKNDKKKNQDSDDDGHDDESRSEDKSFHDGDEGSDD